MRHNKSGRALGRKPDHRQHMMRNMVTSFLDNERITTTVTRAKELRKIAERMITLGKRGDLHSRRQAMRTIRDPKVVARLFDMIAPRYAERPGGYTRILRLDNRAGDNAPMAIIELVEEGYVATADNDTDKATEQTQSSDQKEVAAS
ncbi:MAG: 50S ribosomal protein L17 [Pelovirga sp.]